MLSELLPLYRRPCSWGLSWYDWKQQTSLWPPPPALLTWADVWQPTGNTLDMQTHKARSSGKMYTMQWPSTVSRTSTLLNKLIRTWMLHLRFRDVDGLVQVSLFFDTSRLMLSELFVIESRPQTVQSMIDNVTFICCLFHTKMSDWLA